MPYSLPPSHFLSISLFSFFFLSSLSIDSQGLALLQWRNSLISYSEELRSWQEADPTPCKWYGVGCNPSSEQVISLKLDSINLQGELPSNLHQLRSLNTLVIAGANISGEIPKYFGDFQELSLLDLSKNQISGEIPGEICKLTKLESLALNSNYLVGAIPLELGNLSRLTHLTLFDNDLSGEIPRGIGKLEKLEVFRAGGNQNLRGPLPPEIGNCSNLVMLGLAETGISGKLPPEIGMLKRIQTIAIYTALLSNSIPGEIGNCTELQSLYLYQNLLSGSIPPELGDLQKLQSLLLWQNNLAGPIPPELGECDELVIIDLSLNLLSGSIPNSFSKLSRLQQLQLSTNQLSGTIPPELSNCTALTDVEVDNNELSGELKIEFEKLQSLTLFYAWKNRLTGMLPASLAECRNLQSLDLSYNNLIGKIPRELFALQNLSKLLLISNEFSGFVHPDIGSCTNLFRLRLNKNKLAGEIPPEIGKLKNLNFLDLSENFLVGEIPPAISGCRGLQFLDLHLNSLTGALPLLLPTSLQFLDFSDNSFTGALSSGLTLLPELTKLVLSKNRFSGRIPSGMISCLKLQLLDLGENDFSGTIPPELGLLPSLEIALNLSWNQFSGNIPSELSELKKLTILDLSHNSLTGDLTPLASLQNLVCLNISFNSFSGDLPDTPLFRELPLSDFNGNQGLFITASKTRPPASASPQKLAMSLLFTIFAVLVLAAAYILLRIRRESGESSGDGSWEITMYQKSDLSVDDIVKRLTSANVIGTGSSGVVYQVGSVAVKRMWSAEDDCDAFRNEIAALGSIRHRNIVRLLGWAANKKMKLLFYNYLPNGNLSAMIHRGGKTAAGWGERHAIMMGVAEAVAYLHHDCLPAIIHGDVKAMNVLLGEELEANLADFGLSKVLNGGEGLRSPARIAGSYGYMAPELASMQRITVKSDVYSYGVVLLEVLTARHPLDPSLPGGSHLVQWARDQLHARRDPTELLDPRLHGLSDSLMQEMVQALAISILCVSPRPDDRPTMKDVVALLKEIRRPTVDEVKESPAAARAMPQTRSLVPQDSYSCSL